MVAAHWLMIDAVDGRVRWLALDNRPLLVDLDTMRRQDVACTLDER